MHAEAEIDDFGRVCSRHDPSSMLRPLTTMSRKPVDLPLDSYHPTGDQVPAWAGRQPRKGPDPSQKSCVAGSGILTQTAHGPPNQDLAFFEILCENRSFKPQGPSIVHSNRPRLHADLGAVQQLSPRLPAGS